jgi:hypothetical protein
MSLQMGGSQEAHKRAFVENTREVEDVCFQGAGFYYDTAAHSSFQS